MIKSDQQKLTDEIVGLERAALLRWGNGDPAGFLELYGHEVTYFDPLTAARIDGHKAMADYYAPWTGKIKVERFEILNPSVVVRGEMALLTYNLVNYQRDDKGIESEGSRWNSTTVFERRGDTWKTLHSHWSFTRHKAFQTMTAEESETQNG